MRRIWAAGMAAMLAWGAAQASTGTAVMLLGIRQGPRQAALGGAGAALPDAGRSARFNPALPGLSFPRGRAAVAWHPSWMDIPISDFRIKDWNGPFLPSIGDAGPMYGSLLFRWPALYLPRYGYLAYDRQAVEPGSMWGNFREEVQTLTFSLAEDFLGPAGGEPGPWEWTGGLTAKYWYSRLQGATVEGALYDLEADGVAFDMGWAGRLEGIAFLQGVEQTFGISFLNIGTNARYGGLSADTEHGPDPIPMEYRLGWTAAWAPWDQEAILRRGWTPLRMLIALEAGKLFANRDSDGPLSPPHAFAREFESFPVKYMGEMSTHAGLEAVFLEMASLRWGRMGTSEYSGDKEYWFVGWGLATGPLLRDFGIRWDYCRQLSTKNPDGGLFPNRQYAFNLDWRF